MPNVIDPNTCDGKEKSRAAPARKLGLAAKLRPRSITVADQLHHFEEGATESRYMPAFLLQP